MARQSGVAGFFEVLTRYQALLIDRLAAITRFAAITAAKRSGADATRISEQFESIIEDLETFGGKEGYRYDIIRIEHGDSRFKRLKDIESIDLGGSRLKLVEMPTWKTLPEFINGYLVEAITNGEVWSIGRCNNSACRKFFVAKRTGRKLFCSDRCRDRHNNQREDRKEQNRIRQQRRRKAERRKAKDRQTEALITARFADVLRNLSGNPQSPTIGSRRVLSRLGEGLPHKGWATMTPLVAKLRKGISAKTIWKELPTETRRPLEEILIHSDNEIADR